MVLKKTPESPLDCKEIKPVSPKGDQHFGHLLRRTDPDAGQDWRQEEKGTTEDEMAGGHHRLKGRESAEAPGAGDGQGGLACCSPCGHKESGTTERLNWLAMIEVDLDNVPQWISQFSSLAKFNHEVGSSELSFQTALPLWILFAFNLPTACAYYLCPKDSVIWGGLLDIGSRLLSPLAFYSCGFNFLWIYSFIFYTLCNTIILKNKTKYLTSSKFWLPKTLSKAWKTSPTKGENICKSYIQYGINI